MPTTGRGADPFKSAWLRNRGRMRRSGDVSLLYAHVTPENAAGTSPEQLIFNDWFFASAATPVAVVGAGLQPANSATLAVSSSTIIAEGDAPTHAAVTATSFGAILSTGVAPSHGQAIAGAISTILSVGYGPSHARVATDAYLQIVSVGSAPTDAETTATTGGGPAPTPVGLVCLEWLPSGSPLAVDCFDSRPLSLAFDDSPSLALSAFASVPLDATFFGCCCGGPA